MSIFHIFICFSKSGSGKMFHDKLITNEKIKKGKRIGNGQFGEVYKGNISLKITSFEKLLIKTIFLL